MELGKGWSKTCSTRHEHRNAPEPAGQGHTTTTASTPLPYCQIGS